MKTLPRYSALLPVKGLHPITEIRAMWRAATLARIDYWRKAPEPLHSYGTDGEGRRAVRVLCPTSRQNDLLGGAFRSVRNFADVMNAAAERGEAYRRDGHSGWYTDPDGSTARDGTGLCWGVAAYLGHGRWLAGYVLGGTDCGAYHLDQFYSSDLEAVRAGNEIARIVAEREMEHAEKFRAAQELERQIEDYISELRKALALRNDPRPCFAGIREEAHKLLSNIRADRETLRVDYAGVL